MYTFRYGGPQSPDGEKRPATLHLYSQWCRISLLKDSRQIPAKAFRTNLKQKMYFRESYNVLLASGRYFKDTGTDELIADRHVELGARTTHTMTLSFVNKWVNNPPWTIQRTVSVFPRFDCLVGWSEWCYRAWKKSLMKNPPKTN